MCGILAYFNRDGISSEKLKQSYEALKSVRHRGPDGEGITLINTKDGSCFNLITNETPAAELANPISLQEAQNKTFDLMLGHRRLSIIDVSVNGHQPMFYQNGNWIVFNGEIYNYIEQREELKKAGFVFKTNTDTEVIHAAYSQWGERCLERFNGMFSIIIFDKAKKKLFVANDRFGVKPLYYYKDARQLIFASELRQFYKFDISLNPDKNYLLDFLRNGYEDYDTNTVLKEVQRFSPSHSAFIDLNSDIEIAGRQYYSVNLKQKKISDKEAIETFNHLFDDAVKLRLRSDVPLGFACSGGLDSSAILYNAAHKRKLTNLSTFSAIFPGNEGDESYFIHIIENDLKLNHYYTNPVEEFTFENFEKHISAIEFPPQSTSFFSENCVYKLVQEKGVKVLLIGQGGDELLAGYHHHFYRYCRYLILKGRILEYLSNVKAYAKLKDMDAKRIHKMILMDVVLAFKLKAGLTKLSSKLEDKWHRVDKLAELLKTDLTETMLPCYLRADDRDAMAYGVESRHPFLDYRLVDFCMTLPDNLKIRDGWQKWILRQADNSLPEEIRFRKDKKGFTTPQKKWIQSFKSGFDDYLKYIPEDMRQAHCPDEFRRYGLGVWYKLNNPKLA